MNGRLLKQWALAVAVIAALVAAAFVLRGGGGLPQTPEDAVAALFAAADEGDDATYLRLVWGELRKSLEHTRTQDGAEAFREDLRRSASGIKGLAVMRAGGSPPDHVAVEVEIVFADRKECQRMLLKQHGGGWVITSMAAAIVVEPSIAYNTPVFEEPEPAGPQD